MSDIQTLIDKYEKLESIMYSDLYNTMGESIEDYYYVNGKINQLRDVLYDLRKIVQKGE